MLAFFREYTIAQKLIQKKYHIIFYAENSYYYQYFKHLLGHLLIEKKLKICYITSDLNDTILQSKKENLETYYIKITLGFVFPKLQADVMLLTMPDLNNFHLKRSAGVKEYIYVFHAMVSTHQQYRAHAFDHYDSIFCVGPHHSNEIQEQEHKYHLPKKKLIPYGYPLLIDLKAKAIIKVKSTTKVLIAPSWYQEGILTTCLFSILDQLVDNPYEIWIRPHPEYLKRYPKHFRKLQKHCMTRKNLYIDMTPDVFTHLVDADYLITDRSGIAFEFAYIREKPVLFIETPLKTQNPDYVNYKAIPVENKFRSQLGVRIPITEINNINNYFKKLSSIDIKSLKESIENEMLFTESNWQNGINYIKEKISL